MDLFESKKKGNIETLKLKGGNNEIVGNLKQVDIVLYT